MNNYTNNRDVDNSWGFNFSKFNSNGWSNLNLEASHDPSILYHSVVQDQQMSPLVNQLPNPTTTLFKCLENQNSDQSQIRQVSYLIDNQPQTKKVNHKQYFRIMKRRIKKVLSKYQNNNENANKIEQINKKQDQNANNCKKYIYESRHKHAKSRLRGKDGKFLATRPQEERNRQKKKRGRKPKNLLNVNNIDINNSSTKPLSPHKETASS